MNSSNPKIKRPAVKIACVNCKNCGKKCDTQRPCNRCIRLGFEDGCIDSVRKQRAKGLKRGPYKRSDSRLTPPVDESKLNSNENLISEFRDPVSPSSSSSLSTHNYQIEDNSVYFTSNLNRKEDTIILPSTSSLIILESKCQELCSVIKSERTVNQNTLSEKLRLLADLCSRELDRFSSCPSGYELSSI